MKLRDILLSLLIGAFFGFSLAQILVQSSEVPPNPHQKEADSLESQVVEVTKKIDTVYVRIKELDRKHLEADRVSDTTSLYIDLLFLSDSTLHHYTP